MLLPFGIKSCYIIVTSHIEDFNFLYIIGPSFNTLPSRFYIQLTPHSLNSDLLYFFSFLIFLQLLVPFLPNFKLVRQEFLIKLLFTETLFLFIFNFLIKKTKFMQFDNIHALFFKSHLWELKRVLEWKTSVFSQSICMKINLWILFSIFISVFTETILQDLH